MTFKLLFVACAVSVAGCVNVGMESAVDPLVGQNISVVVGKVGRAATNGSFLGQNIYTWKGGNNSIGYCTVDFFVTDDDTITRSRWSGNKGACSAFASQLRTNIGNIGREG